MKLVFCPICRDIFRLWLEPKSCRCGSSGGRYADAQFADIWGAAVPLIFWNEQVDEAVRKRHDRVHDRDFTVQLPARDHPRFRVIARPD